MALFRISGRASVASGDLTLEDAEGLSVRDGGSWFWRQMETKTGRDDWVSDCRLLGPPGSQMKPAPALHSRRGRWGVCPWMALSFFVPV